MLMVKLLLFRIWNSLCITTVLFSDLPPSPPRPPPPPTPFRMFRIKWVIASMFSNSEFTGEEEEEEGGGEEKYKGYHQGVVVVLLLDISEELLLPDSG